MSRLRENIVSLFTLQTANYLLPLVMVPYLVRVLGPEYFGRLAFAQAFVQYFIVLTDYGFNYSATRAVATVRGDASRLSTLVSAVFIVKTGFMAVGLVVMLGLVLAVPSFGGDFILYLAAYLGVLGNVLFPIWLFQGLERMRQMTAIAITTRAAVLLLLILLVRVPGDYRLAAGLWAGGPVLAGLISVIVLPRTFAVRLRWPGMRGVRNALVDGRHAFISSAAISLYTTSNTFVLGLLAPPAAVGYFAAAQKVVSAVTGLISPVSQAVYPHLSALVWTSREAAIALIGRLLRFQGFATFALSVLLFVSADQITAILLGTEFARVGLLLRLMAAVPFLVGLSNVFGVQVMFVFSLDHLVSRVLVVCGGLNIVLLLLLVPPLREIGAAISVVTVEALVTTLMAAALVRTGHLKAILAPTRSDVAPG